MIKYQMKNWIKLILIFLASFAAIFTLNGLLSMNETHGFFYVTPVKIAIRLVTAYIITVNLARIMKIPIPVIPTITILILGAIAITLMLMTGCQSREYKYGVKGTVSGQPAIWYTDTLSFRGDTAYYANSDGSIMIISPPYKIDTLKQL
jgi:hypothetical protein